MPNDSGAYFSTDTLRFLRELAKNNNREWFQANKARFDASVLQPAVRFTGEVGARLVEAHPHVVFDARPFGGSVSRIYRDTRFSKDKSPYRTNLGVHFGHERSGDSDDHLPGFYFHLAPGESMVASGIWHPAPPSLKRIRDAIVADRAGWRRVRLTAAPSGGESYAKVPAGYNPSDEFGEDLRRKDFFSSAEFKDAEVTAPAFGRTFLGACERLDPLNRFLAKATGVDW